MAYIALVSRENGENRKRIFFFLEFSFLDFNSTICSTLSVCLVAEKSYVCSFETKNMKLNNEKF